MKIIIRTSLLITAAFLTSCASRGTINTKPQQTDRGVVLQVRSLESIANQPTNLSHPVGNIGGVAIGGMSGNAAQEPLMQQSSLQYIIKLNETGKIISVVQSVNDALQPGDHVLVTRYDSHASLVSLDKNYLTH